jgi:peptidoglycan/xylan/chitin deacetylase (PgdA/CDA1 family)
MRRLAVGAVLLGVIAACVPGSDSKSNSNPAPALATTKQPLSSYDSNDTPLFLGDDLGDKELALTFDDGPGPMDVSGDLAEWLTKRPTPIQTSYFINGACVAALPDGMFSQNDSCGEPTPDADAVLAKERSLGHWINNHTSTHRSLTTEVSDDEIPKELVFTDGLISKYLVWNRMFFRAPYGDWDPHVFDILKPTAMNKYVGSIYWNAGGGPTSVANQMAADWECWQGVASDGNAKYSTKKCGDLYLAEIRRLGKGIVLMHDAKGDTANHSLTTGTGNTHDMVQYIVPILESEGFKFKRLDQIPSIAAMLPKCDASCVECSGPAATQCTVCTPDKHVDATGACVAGAPPVDGGTASGSSTSSGGSSSSSSTSGENPSGGSSSGGNNAPPTGGGGADAGTAPSKDAKGCNGSGTSGDFSGALLLGLAVISLRSKRRRT